MKAYQINQKIEEITNWLQAILLGERCPQTHRGPLGVIRWKCKRHRHHPGAHKDANGGQWSGMTYDPSRR